MMDSVKSFTEEANDVLETYISEVGTALSKTELTDLEISNSLDDLRTHIVDHCELKSTGNVISTDHVNSAIKKLGTPDTIASTLQSELAFTEVISDTGRTWRNRSQAEDSTGFEIKAKHLSAFFAVLCWIFTADIIFLLHDNSLRDMANLLPFFYIAIISILVLSRNLNAFVYNRHLQQYLRPNIHTSIMPLVACVVLDQGLYPTSSAWVVPAIFILWLVLTSTVYGRRYFIDLFKRIKDMVENSKGSSSY